MLVQVVLGTARSSDWGKPQDRVKQKVGMRKRKETSAVETHLLVLLPYYLAFPSKARLYWPSGT